MIFNFFSSRTARQANEMQKHVAKLLAAQRDILPAQSVAYLDDALQAMRTAIREKSGDEDLKKQMTNLETTANKWLKPYPNAGIRENVEVLLVALAVAMGIRTFFVQPFKIPTGSMQPTLFGVTSTNLKDRPDVKVPGLPLCFWDGIVHGRFYHEAVAKDDGEIASVNSNGYITSGTRTDHVAKFITKTTIFVRYKGQAFDTPITFWFTPEEHFDDYAAIAPGMPFHKGDEIVKFVDVAGDHLFVDRVTYNFRPPKRGEIIVFETHDIGNQYHSLPPDQFYIKRLVALSGEHVRIGNDRHLVINGQRLDAATPHFENVYSFDPKQPPRESHYSGHLNQTAASVVTSYPIAPLFPGESATYDVRPGHFMVMGDNTMNSLDSRVWGDFSQTNVIGKYFFVYWPFSDRFGWSAK